MKNKLRYRSLLIQTAPVVKIDKETPTIEIQTAGFNSSNIWINKLQNQIEKNVQKTHALLIILNKENKYYYLHNFGSSATSTNNKGEFQQSQIRMFITLPLKAPSQIFYQKLFQVQGLKGNDNFQKQKRKIQIQNIAAITISRCGYEFVLHVPDEYDYRFSCLDFRDNILQTITEHSCRIRNKKLAFNITDDLTLIPYTTTKVDIKKSIKKSFGEPIYLDLDDLNNLDLFTNQNIKDRVLDKFDFENHYKILRLLNQGNIAQIILVQNKINELPYVFKCFQKQEVISTDHLNHLQNERKLLEILDHPFIIKLHQAFETDDKIFLVLPFYQGGDLYFHLRNDPLLRLKEERVKFYIAQLMLVFGYLHSLDYVYRDLKPENILMDNQGYIYLTDFGFTKQVPNYQFCYSLLGTVEYLAPEMITANGYGRMVDWWQLGILCYELLVGITPFYSDNQSQIFENILEREIRFPPDVKLSLECKDFIIQLLRKDIKDRLGFKRDLIDIQNHQWFRDINFNNLLAKKLTSPWKPNFDRGDLSYFEHDEITLEMLINQNYDKQLVDKFDKDFGKIGYNL